MHGDPENLLLERFVDDFLSQVSIGMDGVPFQFGESGTISGVGPWKLLDSSRHIIDQAMDHAERDAYRLHHIFNPNVMAYLIDPPRSFSLSISIGHNLIVFDDSLMYEFFQIFPDEIHV